MVLTDLTVKDNLGDGIHVTAGGARTQRNTVTGNGGFGILASAGAFITENNVQNNEIDSKSVANIGILAGPGSEVTGNRASFNVEEGIVGVGIRIGPAAFDGEVRENDVEENLRNGINVVCPALILDNKVLNNNTGNLGGRDIRVTGQDCILSGNHQ